MRQTDIDVVEPSLGDGELWQALRCPACARDDSPLARYGPSWLVGTSCAHKYPMKDGIPVLLAGEGEAWANVSLEELPAQGENGPGVDLSVVIPALREADNLRSLMPQLRQVLDELGVGYEILLVTGPRDADTQALAQLYGARVVEQQERGYGGALLAGFGQATGKYILTMDADLSHPPGFIHDLWQRREDAEVTIASRYVPGGAADMPPSRYVLSRILNVFFSRGLSLNVRDMSSGFRLFKADMLRRQTFAARDFDILQEILVRAYVLGWKVQEVPFAYAPRREGSSHARLFKFGLAYLRTFWSLWRLRNSAPAADYDARAYNAPIFLQRYWQRQRVGHIVALISGGAPVLDVGCGSSRTLAALPPGSIGIDASLPKLRFARVYGKALAQASALNLPFRDGSVPCIVCSQLIEHLPGDSPLLAELSRVLAPGGRLVLGTLDYGRWEWPTIEQIYRRLTPAGQTDHHLTRFTRDELLNAMQRHGLQPEAERSILRSEVIVSARKPEGDPDLRAEL